MKNRLLLGSLFAGAVLAVACGDANTNQLSSGGTGSGTSGGASGSSGASGTIDGTSSGASGASGSSSGTSGGSSGTSGGSSGTSGGSSGTSGGTDAGSPPPAPAGAGLPCNVIAVLQAKCIGCHSDPPVNGSLSGLVTVGDLLATAKEDASKNEAQLSVAKMQAGTMPPASVNNPATAAEIAAFQSWIAAGYMGTCGDGGAPPPPSDVFTGAPAFNCTAAGSSHNAGRDCLGCHNGGGEAPKFTWAGTLTDGAGAKVAGAEVRMVDAAGKAVSVCSDNSGNFHTSSTWTSAAHVGVRNASTKALMVGTITNGGCNGCHVTGGTQVPIHLP